MNVSSASNILCSMDVSSNPRNAQLHSWCFDPHTLMLAWLINLIERNISFAVSGTQKHRRYCGRSLNSHRNQKMEVQDVQFLFDYNDIIIFVHLVHVGGEKSNENPWFIWMTFGYSTSNLFLRVHSNCWVMSCKIIILGVTHNGLCCYWRLLP